MSPLIFPVAFATSLLSALALYAGSRHCRLRVLHALHRAGTLIGGMLAVASLALWIRALGIGAGISAMLGSWMLGLVALPYLGAWIAGNPAREES